MATNIYPNRKTQDRIEGSTSFAGSIPLEAAIDPGMEKMTLTQLGRQLQKQLANSGAIGIKLIEVRFQMIHEPGPVK